MVYNEEYNDYRNLLIGKKERFGANQGAWCGAGTELRGFVEPTALVFVFLLRPLAGWAALGRRWCLVGDALGECWDLLGLNPHPERPRVRYPGSGRVPRLKLGAYIRR
jgi:hypothetical protein